MPTNRRKVMYMPLVVLAVFAVFVGWRTAGAIGVQIAAGAGTAGRHAHTSVDRHADRICIIPASTTRTAGQFHDPADAGGLCHGAGRVLAGHGHSTAWRLLEPQEVGHQFGCVYRFLLHKWYFDELYKRFSFSRCCSFRAAWRNSTSR